MDKLGYTFYPKDWWTSDTFFKLPPELRYLYLEIISLMYLNDGFWKASRTELTRRFGLDPMESGWELLQSLFIVNEDIWTHPSVNKRLRKTLANRENGQLGGRPKTQITQPVNPVEPTLEREEKEKVKEKVNEVIENTLPQVKLKRDIVDVKESFRVSLIPYVGRYGKSMIREFFEYWVEMSLDGKKMRFQDEKFFSIPKRIARWKKNEDEKRSKFGPKETVLVATKPRMLGEGQQ